MVQGRLDSPRLPSSGAGIYACATRCRRLHVSKPGTRGSESARWAEVLAQVFGELRSTDTLMATTTGSWVDHSPGTSAQQGTRDEHCLSGAPSPIAGFLGLRAEGRLRPRHTGSFASLRGRGWLPILSCICTVGPLAHAGPWTSSDSPGSLHGRGSGSSERRRDTAVE